MSVKDLPICITRWGSLILPMADVVYYSDKGVVDFSQPFQGTTDSFYRVLESSRVNNQLEPIGKFRSRPHYVQG